MGFRQIIRLKKLGLCFEELFAVVFGTKPTDTWEKKIDKAATSTITDGAKRKLKEMGAPWWRDIKNEKTNVRWLCDYAKHY